MSRNRRVVTCCCYLCQVFFPYPCCQHPGNFLMKCLDATHLTIHDGVLRASRTSRAGVAVGAGVGVEVRILVLRGCGFRHSVGQIKGELFSTSSSPNGG